MSFPSTRSEVVATYREIKQRTPVYPSYQYGKRRTVAIPVRHGVTAIGSTDDLLFDDWFQVRGGCGVTLDHVYVDVFPPFSNIHLETGYSIVYCVPEDDDSGSVNNNRGLVNRRMHKHNILVVRHGHRKPVVNMREAEAMLVDTIVSTYVVCFKRKTINVFKDCRRYLEMGLLD
ncbi:hypothetical protein C8J57DRAFT_1492375 [Mycena rebaudengoi]|nr:hypothetical protein C8J57DRAFT_1492375 [Mycena rebaudengoi]